MKVKGRNILTGHKAFNYFFILCVFCCSCSSENSQDIHTPAVTFFDIPNYFKSEAERLSDEGRFLEKIVDSNGESESKIIKTVDWHNELRSFIDIDLNKPALQQAYTIDTVSEGQKSTLIYSAIDSLLEFKNITITFADNKLIRFTAVHSKKNFYYTSYETMTYEPIKGYVIQIENKIRTGEPILLRIEGSILLNKD